MKTTKILMLATLLVMAFNTQAQAVKVDRHYGGTTPAWAPKAPVKTQYYYLPDIQTYYDVPAKRYIYQQNGSWVRTAALPTRYKGYDLYHGQTVYLTDYKGNAPYKYYHQHKVKYVGKEWKKNGHDNGNHYGQFKNKNKGHEHDEGNQYGQPKKIWNGKDHEKDDDDDKDHDNDNEGGNGKGHGKGHGKK
ncbi:hypothetical protein [Flavobacterium sp.]|uniref:hypothetical protein n=1 Tax=Flavobacterium sp. TaxID=239 RepID=UPI0025E56D59|nr:hypothetical protein [Flavobacterium sp.]